MDTFTTPAHRLTASERAFLVEHLTRPHSDFAKALEAGTQKGSICLCLDQGEIVGWARSEDWESWPTLEAFVRPQWRERGVASLCAAGLRASNVYGNSGRYCAVFRPPMLAVAARAGLAAILFTHSKDGWRVDWSRRCTTVTR